MAREPQVTRVSVKGPGISVLPVKGAGAGWFLGYFLLSPHLCACVPGEQRACGAISVTLEGMSGQ